MVERLRGAIRWMRSSRRAALITVAAVALAVIWIGWAIRVTVVNGTAAGFGVLVSWPAALAVLALLSTPLIAAAIEYRRRYPSPPPGATGGGATAAGTALGFVAGPPVKCPVGGRLAHLARAAPHA